MNIAVENAGACKKLVKVEVPFIEMGNDISVVQRSVQQRANVPGFRIGKAPMNLVEQYYGDVIQNEAIKQVINTSYQKVLEEKKLHPIGQPAVENVDYKPGEKLSFQFEIEIAPDFDVPKYVGIPLKKKKLAVTDEHIEAELKYLQEKNAFFEPVADRGVQMDDFAIVDYNIQVKNQIMDEAKQVWIEMRADFFIPKFCEDIVGMKKGEEKEIKVTLPKEYAKPELSGKKVSINVKLQEIKKKVLPELNEEFVKQTANCSTVDELKKKIREELEAYFKQVVDKDMVSQLEDYLLKNTKIDVPESIVNNFHDALYEDTVSYLKSSGKATDEHIKEKEKDIKESTKKDAISQVKLLYILEGVAEKEKIEVSEDEINQQINATSVRTGKKPEEVRKFLEEKNKWWDFKYRLRNDKITKFLLEKAEVKEVEVRPEDEMQKKEGK
jgi:trigger factor